VTKSALYMVSSWLLYGVKLAAIYTTMILTIVVY